MTEDDCCSVSMPESTPATDSSNTRQRKRSKWDQPAESLVSAGVAVPVVVLQGNMRSFIGIEHPGVAPVSSASLVNPLTAGYGHLQQVLLAPSIQQHATALAQIIQPKIQEELIAREIVINDAESSVRYKLTKRQTQEEIQKCTGAIVITRGKYRPPNAPSNGEKPLYLHVSAGTHLETTADRIKAVDQAAAMIEDILKQGAVTNGKVVQPFSTCVFLGFVPDPSLNIIARIRGPNDQYVNHIMNETGSTVLLRGCGSGNSGSSNSEEQQSLHLFLSSNNPKSLEHAKLLAENLLDTICAECGASRASSCKVYGAVPPPQQLLAGVQSTAVELERTAKTFANSTSSTIGFVESPVTSLVSSPGTATVLSNGTTSQCHRGLNPGHPLPGVVCNPQSSLNQGTSYNGYGGIYPQATPLQQVALALRQSTSPITSTVAHMKKVENTTTSTVSEKERRPPQKRKFQELPVAAEGPVKTHQGLEMHRRPQTSDTGIIEQSEVKSRTSTRMSSSSMPAPVKLVEPSYNGMMSLPPKTMPPPPPSRMAPPPPNFNSPAPVTKVLEANSVNKSVPETLISLMEYGDEDDDIDATDDEPVANNSKSLLASKPFWAA